MRVLMAALVSVGLPPAAQALEDCGHLADIVADVCITPETPALWISTAQTRAKFDGWLSDPVRSRPRPGLAKSREEEQALGPAWQEKAWFLEQPGDNASELDIWAAASPDMPQSSCVISLAGAASKEMVLALRAKLALGEALSFAGRGETWVLSGDPSKSNESSKSLFVTEQQIAAGPSVIPPGGVSAIPRPVKTRTFAGVISLVYSPGSH